MFDDIIGQRPLFTRPLRPWARGRCWVLMFIFCRAAKNEPKKRAKGPTALWKPVASRFRWKATLSKARLESFVERRFRDYGFKKAAVTLGGTDALKKGKNPYSPKLGINPFAQPSWRRCRTRRGVLPSKIFERRLGKRSFPSKARTVAPLCGAG